MAEVPVLQCEARRDAVRLANLALGPFVAPSPLVGIGRDT
jgi:hypothetical protein